MMLNRACWLPRSCRTASSLNRSKLPTLHRPSLGLRRCDVWQPSHHNYPTSFFLTFYRFCYCSILFCALKKRKTRTWPHMTMGIISASHSPARFCLMRQHTMSATFGDKVTAHGCGLLQITRMDFDGNSGVYGGTHNGW